jgi:hypothetical protein
LATLRENFWERSYSGSPLTSRVIPSYTAFLDEGSLEDNSRQDAKTQRY